MIIENQWQQRYVRFCLHNGFLNPTGNYIFKVNNRNTRTRCEICSKLAIKTQNDAGLYTPGLLLGINFRRLKP